MKILEFFGEPLSYGGQEAFILNMYTYFRKEADYCFATPFHANHQELLRTIEARGDRWVACGYPFESRRRKLFLLRAGRRLISRDYDVIHIHSGSVFNLAALSWLAKRKGLKVVVHAHATGISNASHRLIRALSEPVLLRSADAFLACSREAADFMFPKRAVEQGKVTVLKNGIDVDRFAFWQEDRDRIRKQLGLENRLVLCSVGRFSPEKNHLFLLEAFVQLRKREPRAALLLVGGDGPLRDTIRTRIREAGLEGDVRLLLERRDVPDLLSAADVFALPSLYEGLGISAVEAQASGLPVLCSEHVPEAAAVSHLFHRLPLERGPEAWAAELERLARSERQDVRNEIRQHGYAAEESARELERIYAGLT